MRFGSEPVEGMTLGEWWAIADEVDAATNEGVPFGDAVARALAQADPPECFCHYSPTSTQHGRCPLHDSPLRG